ncbi:hypothetical protein C4D60_Mb01t15210 [Musa balbisiana]|uniref:Uncharacterized protein n=1 Tax=Musa balbisiana TaxID=52838 RepID=A0A4S8JNA5_MUSBA|nr:hypothetical protein C4D60_Mb01t15210 [Musa balbisiana]
MTGSRLSFVARNLPLPEDFDPVNQAWFVSLTKMRGEPQMGLDEENIPNDSDPLIQRQIESSQPPEGLDKIKDEEADAGSCACCRICLENESFPVSAAAKERKKNNLLQCRGNDGSGRRRAVVSRDGSKRRSEGAEEEESSSEGFAFSHCTTCKAQFHLRVEFLEDYSWRKIKFRVFVARDVFLVFLAIQTVIATIGGFVYFLDKNGGFRNSFSDSWDRILSKHPVPFYYCIGVLVFFVLLGFFGLILHCSSFDSSDPCMTGCRNCCYGWGILDCFPASMEACFALEYVVEDLHGYYTPPKMDPEHEERLRVLKLL